MILTLTSAQDNNNKHNNEHKKETSLPAPPPSDLNIMVQEQRDTGKVRCFVWGWFLALACGRPSIQPDQKNGHQNDHQNGQKNRSSRVGFALACCLILVFAAAQSAKSFTDISLLWYGSLPPIHTLDTLNSTTTTRAQFQPTFLQEWNSKESTSSWTLFLYLCVLSMWALSLFRSCFMVNLFLRSARELHRAVLHRLLRGPLVYFQRRPHGRILNKFSSDVMKADMMLPDQAQSLLENVSGLFAAFALSVVSVPWLGLVLIPAVASLCVVVNLFRATSREVVRLDGEARSPVFSSFGDALNARVTLRAFNVGQRVRDRTCQQIDVANSVNLLHKMLDRWNSMRLNGIMSMYATCLFLAAILIRREPMLASSTSSSSTSSSAFDPSVVGLALVYSLQLMGLSSWTAMTFVQTENALTSVERLYQLMEMPQEAPTVQPNDPTVAPKQSTTSWPTVGRLILSNVSLRYRRGLPLALDNLQLDVRGGERIGIVGRTGAGKSSIFVSLLRLTEPEKGSSIVLDGQELTTVGLQLVRRHLITLIPQNPVVFSGSIQFNLDPYQEHTDDVLWCILRDLQMESVVQARGGLTSDCGKNGSSLSHGQRQLLVVGRALLQHGRTRVYLLDEATSSMDDATDAIVQRAIRKYAKGITTIIVAHRLTTVLHCDRIAVMDQGRISQIGQPSVLVHAEGGPFAAMMASSGIPVQDWPVREV